MLVLARRNFPNAVMVLEDAAEALVLALERGDRVVSMSPFATVKNFVSLATRTLLLFSWMWFSVVATSAFTETALVFSVAFKSEFLCEPFPSKGESESAPVFTGSCLKG